MTESLRAEARRLGIPYSTLWTRRQKAVFDDMADDRWGDFDHPGNLSDSELWDATKTLGAKLVADRTETETIELTLPNEVSALAFTGDWHLGNRGTDMEALERDLGILSRTPGLYVVGMGDYYDNYKPNSGRVSEGLLDASLPDPEDQRRLAKYALRKIDDRLVGAVVGCHLDWDRKVGYDSLRDLLSGLPANSLGRQPAHLGYGGVIKLKVGSETYTGLVRHKYGGNSTNTTNAQRKAQAEYPVSAEWDFIAFAHFHFPDLQVHEVAGRDQVWVRSGSYKILDRYGQRLGGYTGIIGTPVIFFHPTEHRMWGWYGPDLKQAATVLGLIRSGVMKWP